MNELPKRKKLRLEGYDYTSCGRYFITLCIEDRNRLLWSPVGENFIHPDQPLPLSDVGKMIEKEIQKLHSIYENVVVDKYCILPDHIHLILFLVSDESGSIQSAPAVSRIVKQLKGVITKQVGISIWQKSFYDRIIRNEEEYRKIWEYIDSNPYRLEEDDFIFSGGRKGDQGNG